MPDRETELEKAKVDARRAGAKTNDALAKHRQLMVALRNAEAVIRQARRPRQRWT